ncbi:MAG: hypothetical protein U1D30_06965 [Planctomycetota bacterium]
MGGNGSDTLTAGLGNDELRGGWGDDYLYHYISSYTFDSVILNGDGDYDRLFIVDLNADDTAVLSGNSVAIDLATVTLSNAEHLTLDMTQGWFRVRDD